MKKTFALAGIILCMFPMTAFAAPAKMAHKMPIKKAAMATMYECQKCHMKVSAAVAKKDGFKDPMDGGKILHVKPSGSHGSSMSGMKM